MRTTLSTLVTLCVFGLIAVGSVGCRRAAPTPTVSEATPSVPTPSVPVPAGGQGNAASAQVRQVIQKRRNAESKKLSPAVKQAVGDFDRTAAKAEKQLDSLPPKRAPDAPPARIDLTESAQQAVAVWQAAHPKVPAGPGKRLDVPGYRQENDDDCGPTAVRSVVQFHQKADPGIGRCRKAVFTDFTPVLPGSPVTGLVTGFRGFTMPSGIKIGVTREFSLPCAERRKCSADDLRRAINQGQPPIVLVRSGDKLLHWLIVVGYSDAGFTVLDPGDGKEHAVKEAHLVKSWNLDGDYENGGDYSGTPGVLKGYRRVTLVINDDGPDDAGTAEFVVEQIAILGLDALRRGADPRLIGDAMNVVANAVGADTELGKALKTVGGLAEAVASGKKLEDVAFASTEAVEGLLQQAGVLPKDSKLAEKAQRAIEIAGKIDQLFRAGLKDEARKLIEEFTGISKEFSGILNDPANALGMDSAMVPALGVLQAGLKIADICRKWGELSDLGKVSAALDGLSSAAMAAQAFCSVAVCEVKGPLIVLAMLLKDLVDLGIDLGLDGPGGGSRKKDGGSGSGGKPQDKKPEQPADGGSEPGTAGAVAKAAGDRGATPEQIGEAVAAAVGDPGVKQAVARAVAAAKEKKKDVGEAVEQLDEVKQASERQRGQDTETAKKAAEEAKKAEKPDNPAALADAAVNARKDLAGDKQQLQNLIAAETKAGRSPEETVRRALARLRAEKAQSRLNLPK